MNIFGQICRGLIPHKWIYVLAISSIFILVAFAQFLIQRRIGKQGNDAIVINLAGKQRMLSQNITKNALLLNQEKEDLINRSIREDSLSKLLKEWERAHMGLQFADSLLSLPGNNTQEIIELFTQIEPHYQAIQKASWEILETDKKSQREKAIQMILFHEPNFLFGMNAIVKQYETEATQKMKELSQSEWWLAIFTIAILILEARFIFFPSYRRIKVQRDELVQFNTELQNTQAQLEEITQAKENVFSVVTHELRTPLNGIIGVSELLADSGMKDDYREHISVLQSSSKHLLALINDLLDLSKIRSGGLELESIPFDLHKEIREVRESFNLRAKKKGLFLRFYLPVHTPQYIVGDPVRLKQILTNLINNAMKLPKLEG